MAPELECRILDEFNECDEKSPRVRPVYNEPLEEYSGDLLLNGFSVCLGEQVEEAAREVVSVRVGVAQLVSNAVQE